MRLEILHVPECPNVALLEARLSQVLAGQDGIAVTHRELGTIEEAAAAGMTGSPTLLVDGVDPFSVPGQEPSLSCRLYRTPNGPVEGAPTPADMQAALGFSGD